MGLGRDRTEGWTIDVDFGTCLAPEPQNQICCVNHHCMTMVATVVGSYLFIMATTPGPSCHGGDLDKAINN